MTILDRSKIRPEILESNDNRQKELVPFLTEYLQKKENQQFNFTELWGKNLDGNAYFFKNGVLDDHLLNLLTQEEVLFLARFMRANAEQLAVIGQKHRPIADDIRIEKIEMDGVPVEWQVGPDAHKDRVFLFIHGGGWVLGSPPEHRQLSTAIGHATKTKVISADYRLAPEHPYPAALDDCVAVYNQLLSNGTKPENIIIGGDSAGGNLTLTTLLYLKDHNIPLPAGGVCLAPATDLSFSDESYFARGETDLVLADLGIFWWCGSFIGHSDVKDPTLSPLFGDLKGLPPLLVQASTSEMLYSDATRFVEKALEAGVDVTLQTWDDIPHVFQGGDPDVMPEVTDALQKIGQFVLGLYK